MKNYQPKSWSESARELSNQVVENVNSGSWCIEQASRFFSRSYRHPRIVNRAAKRFGRLRRAGKVQENPESITLWHEYKKQYNIE